MSNQLYKKLAALDRGIASAYLTVTKGKPDAIINQRGAAQLFGQVRDGRKITTQEAEALVLLLENVSFTDEALEFLQDMVSSDTGTKALIRGAGRVLTTDDELDEFFQAMDLTAQISFFSPGSWHTYRPIQFQVIKRLVKRGDLEVVKVEDRRLYSYLGDYAALYDQVKNRFLFFELDGQKRFITKDLDTLVHEAAHAIQDWLGVSTVSRYIEADAYIAGAVALRVQRRTEKAKSGPHKAAFDAAPFVLNGAATDTNLAWEKAYFKVVSAVQKDPGYCHQALKVIDMEEDEGQQESAEFRRLQRILTRSARTKARKSA